jgi:signal transduction histidine kinase
MESSVADFVHTAQLNSANHLAENISIKIDQRKRFVDNLSNVIPQEFMNNNKKMQEWLEQRPHALELFAHGVAILNINGKVIAQNPIIKHRSKVNFSKASWFKQAQKSDGVILSKPFIGKAKKDPMVAIAKSIKDSQNQIVGVIYGAITIAKKGFLKELYESQKGVGSGFLLISTKYERFLASSIKKLILKPTPPKGKNKLHDKAMAGFRGVGITKNAFGITELSAIATVKDTDWFLVIKKPIKDVYTPINRLNEIMIYIVFISVFIILAVLIIVLKWVLQPLKDNSIIVNEIADNKRNLQTLPIKHEDEIGDFVNGFNMMVKRVQDDIGRQAQMAQMGEMISIIAHQWKQPIASISAVSQSLRFKSRLNKLNADNINNALQDIDNQIEFMIDTIDEFRHFFNPDKKKKETDLKKTIQMVIDLLEIPLKANGVKLQIDIKLESVLYTFNNLVIQVLLNIMKNANEQFANQENKVLQLIAYEDDDYSYILVKDNAGGIPKDVLPNIFDKYFSTKDEKNGTGIGLDFCKQAIENECGGSLVARNENDGAVFEIKLPKNCDKNTK